ncbi:hypothetical protein VHUM_03093 [Vanrija humicola]|uniref:Uncharacterized protein n=1 Tax=Vanrija humicola TaxID=5417 RepID=A0A7D8UZA8_VANHU|nr:hypothetical protein VHUM_03093 [Vanrija humicola]
MATVGAARKAAKVPYPNFYVSDAEAKADQNKYKYNCAQRAHGNTLENVPSVIALFGFLSIFHPVVATSAVVVWCIGRVFYTVRGVVGPPVPRPLSPVPCPPFKLTLPAAPVRRRQPGQP